MPRVPICSLCKAPEKVRVYLESNKKIVCVYSIFLVLLIEWFSYFYVKFSKVTPNPNNYFDYYSMKLYPMLTQLAMFLLFFSLFLWKDRLHFCFRKSATTFYLAVYYLIGFISVLFCLSNSIYTEIVSVGTIAISSLLFIVSFFKTE